MSRHSDDRVRRRARGTLRRFASGGMVAALGMPAVLLLARADGLPGSRVDLSSGVAWLASPAQGVVSLIDGASEQFVGLVPAPGARAGDDLSVVQAGTSAYVVNSTQGTVSRVDGGTYEVLPPVRFGVPGGPLEVITGGPGLYVVDGSRRTASVTDPASLRVRQRLSLAARPGPQQSVVDSTGRLWVMDAEGGGLTWFDRAKRVRPAVGDGRSRLVLVQGQPVLVDATQSRMGRIGDDGQVSSWSCLDIRAGDNAELLGSAVTPRVYAVVPAAGTLVAAGLDGDDCELSMEVGRPGDRYGPLVEVGGYVFVPNRTSGRTIIVDTAARQVAAELSVTKPGARLVLVAKDGLVFYHDLDSELAGVLRFDGVRWRVGKALRKYNPSDLGDGALLPGGDDAKDGAKTEDEQGRQGDGSPDGQPDPDDPTDPNDPGNQDPNGPSDPSDPSDPADPGDPSDPGDPGGSDDPPPPPPQDDEPPAIQSLTLSPATPVRGRDVTFTAEVTNAPDATWRWTLLDLAGNVVHQSADVGTMVHRLPADSPADLLVQLEVETTVDTDTAEQAFTTTPLPVPQVALSCTPAAAGVRQQIACDGDEPVGGAQGTWTWTVTDLASGGTVLGPEVRPALQDLSQTFTAAGQFRVTLSVEFDGETATVSDDIGVTDGCDIQPGSQSEVDLRGADTGSIAVQVRNCFGDFGGLQHTLAPFLVVDGSSVNVDPQTGDGTATVTVRIASPPQEGRIANAIAFRLSNNDSVSYAVLTNRPPLIRDAICLDLQNGSVAFIIDIGDDNNLDDLTVELRVGGATFSTSFGGPSDPPDDYTAVVAKSELPDVTSYSATATDPFERSDTGGPFSRGSCW